jgi:uncharacterized protein (DUF2249 family)
MSPDKPKLYITPETKLKDVLDTYPELERILLEISPAFAKLQNPLLRRTVARVANLKQVAQTGDIPLANLINRLRLEVGDESTYHGDLSGSESEKPDWWQESRIAKRLDARPILEAGDHPLGRVLKETQELQQNEIYELVTPFLPAPLIDKVKEQGLEAWTLEKNDQEFRTYFVRK